MNFKSVDLSYAIAKARTRFAALRVHYLLQELNRKGGFNPDQPRVPAGDSDGGQWTGADGSSRTAIPRDPSSSRSPERQGLTRRTVSDGTGSRSWRRYTEQRLRDGSLVARTVENRDRSRVETSFSHGMVSSGTRSTVVLEDGTRFTFETEGDTQRIYDPKGRQVVHTEWTLNGPIPQAIVQSAGGVTVLGTRQLIEAGRRLYNSAVEFGEYLGSAFAFRAWDHNRDNAEAQLTFSGDVERDKVEALCPELPTVQALTDEAARYAGDTSNYPSAAVYGTAVHTRLRDMIRALRNPRLEAESSLMKRQEEDPATLGSIRIDVVETREDGTICVYDIKTGRRGLSSSRVSEFAKRLRDTVRVARTRSL